MQTNLTELTCLAFVAALLPGAVSAQTDPQKVEFFENHVRPILVKRCYDCHSHAGGEIRGGLALDSRSGWELGGDSGPAVVPGDLGKSLLLRAVRRQGEVKMPPDEELPAAEIDVLAKWIQDGAADPRRLDPKFDPANWWSFQPLVRPAVPASSPPVQPIDAFVRAKLKEKQLSPAPAADRRTLIRRLTFDLHGLPPTAEEVAAFVADPDPRAYEKLVDRLLDSPRYGERWGRHWLDVVRYGDSRGNEHDGFRDHAWRYRDYVIDALNRDRPYDRFIQEQLAADALEPDNAALTAALGFLVAGPDVLSGGEQLERDEYISVTMSAFTSTTTHCARCHHHKFDPIRHDDYYALQAVLAGVRRRDVPVDVDPAVRTQRAKWTNLKTLAARKPVPPELLADENRRLVADWQKLVEQQAANWKTLRPQQATAASGTAIAIGDDGVLRVDANAADNDEYTLTLAGQGRTGTLARPDDDAGTGKSARPTLPEKFRLLRLEALSDGDFSLSEFEVWLQSPGKNQPQRIGLKTARANAELKDHPADRVRDNRPETGWRGGPATAGVPHTLVVEGGSDIAVPDGGQLRIVLKHQQGSRLSLAKFRVSVSDQTLSPLTLPPAPVAALAGLAADKRTDEQWFALMTHALPLRCDEELAKLPAPTMFYVGAGNLPHEPKAGASRTVQILKRGERAVGSVGPGALKFVSQLESRIDDKTADSEPAQRLWLARWLSHNDNPLTWRSIVNRVWHHHFGRGICDTPSDLGHQGGVPSHVELLDWLACEFRDQGKSLKKLHRWIVTSETYRQAVVPNAAAERIDRDNRLLWRANRQRLDAESFRDAVLAASGGLDSKMGGPGVMQFEVKNGFNTTKLANYDRFDWNAQGAGRRSVYRFVFRTRPDPFMTAMDFPDASQFVPARATSVTPLQTLALFNNHFVLQNCERLAAQISANEPAAAVQVAFRRVLQREPSPEERAEFAAYADEFGLAAMCRVLFNSNEFLFVE